MSSSERHTRFFSALSLAVLVLLTATLVVHAILPIELLVASAAVEGITAGVLGAAALVSGVKLLAERRPELRRDVLFVLAITLLVFLMHVYILNSPPTTSCSSSTKLGCIMDETYYVPAARALLTGEQCAPYADSCNMEHPFLAKAVIAAGMAVFGVNDIGWRFFVMLLGTLSVPLVFVLVRLVSSSRRLSYFATLLFASDTLFFVHSSAALIDVPAVFFALLGFVVYFWYRGNGLFDRYFLSGLLLGLSLLSKETSVFFIATLLTYDGVTSRSGFSEFLLNSMKLVLSTSFVFAAGLQVYDSLYAASSFPLFYQHVQFMLTYGSGLTCPPLVTSIVTGCGAWTDAVTKQFITPLNWLVYYSPVSYYVTNVTVNGSSSHPEMYTSVGYYGVTNFIVVWLVFAWVPVAVARILRGGGELESSGEYRVCLFALSWFAWGFIPYILLWAYGRVTYPFYILPAIPALAIGAAYFVTRDWFPRVMAYIYVLAAFFWFFYYFPLKDFLPVWLRVLLGR